MTDRTAKTADAPEKSRRVRSLLRGVCLWFAGLNYWIVVGGFVVLGFALMQTESFDSFAVLCSLQTGGKSERVNEGGTEPF